MQDTLTSTSSSLRRRTGPVGGVLSGIGHKTGVNATLLRAGTVIAGIAIGPAVLLAYLVAWLLMPVDGSIPAHQRPSSVPGVLLAIVAAVLAFQIIVGFLTSLPFTWIALGAIAAYWLFIRD